MGTVVAFRKVRPRRAPPDKPGIILVLPVIRIEREGEPPPPTWTPIADRAPQKKPKHKPARDVT